MEGLADMVYIDGDHSLEAVKEDIKGWAEWVRPGGVVFGHDYALHAEDVIRAVHGHIEAVGASLHLGPDMTWWYFIPGNDEFGASKKNNK